MLFWLRKFSYVILICMILSYCVAAAINAELGNSVLPDVIFGLLFVITVFITSKKLIKFFLCMSVLAIIKIFMIPIAIYYPIQIVHACQSAVAMVFFFWMMFYTLYLTHKEKRINFVTLLGSLSSYLFMGLAFAYLYLLIYMFFPQDFSGLEPYAEIRGIYYSFIILTTVGFSDVVAHSPVVQTLSWIESFLGQAYVMLFISRLMGHYVSLEIKEEER